MASTAITDTAEDPVNAETPDAAPEQQSERDQRRRRASAWLISGSAHLAAFAVLGLMVATHLPPMIDTPILRTATLATQPEPPTPTVRDHQTQTTTLVADLTVETSASDVQLPTIEPLSQDDSAEAAPSDRPDDQSVSVAETGHISAFMGAIGVGDGGSRKSGDGKGLMGTRGKGAGAGGKPPRAKLSAIEASLRWFARHQSPDGSWEVAGYQLNCQDGGARCEPGTEHATPSGNLACSGLAVLCFLGHGHDGVLPSKHRATVARGVQWLLAQQRPDGSFGERNYEHAIVLMALSEALAMAPTGYGRHQARIQKAVDVLINRQNPSKQGKGASGWDYIGPNPGRDDSSVTGWAVMALKSAASAGLDVRRSLHDAKTWLKDAWLGANPKAASLSTSDQTVFPYSLDPRSGAVEHQHLAGVGATCAAFLGHQRGDPLLETLVNRIVAVDLPQLRTWPCNTYILYYDTLAMFQAVSGGKQPDPRWTAWEQPIDTMLINAQRRDAGCFDGSYDWQGTGFHGHATGRLLSTALCTLSLEAFERWRVVTNRGQH